MVKITDKQAKENYQKTQRAHNYFMNIENNAAAYHDYMMIVNQPKEYAEKILNTPLAD